MTTTIDGLPSQATIEPGDLFVLQNTAANRTRHISYANLISELLNDMGVVTTTQLTTALAGITSAYQAADAANMQKVFKVGSKITLIGPGALTNPASELGFGTWVMEEGRYYVGYKPADTNFNNIGGTLGSVEHNHGGNTGGTILNATQIPAHVHVVSFPLYRELNYGQGRVATGDPITAPEDYHTSNTSSVGDSQPHNHTIATASNLPPSIVEVVWRRTA